MNKIVPFLILLAFTINLNAQDLNGVWVSIHQKKNSKQSGMILDFNANKIGSIKSNKTGKLEVNRKQTKIKADGFKGKLLVQKRAENVLVLKGKNSSYTFKKLDSKSKIAMSKKELSSFITGQFCDEIQGIKSQFTKEQFFVDKKNKKPHNRNQFINFTHRDNGYWYIKKINGMALFVFTVGQDKIENIFQISSMSLNGLKLTQLQNSNQVRNLTEIKTCL